MKRAKRVAFIGLAIFGCVVLPVVVTACPACKEALFDPGQLHQKLSTAKGYALSIVLLLAVPLALLSGFAALIIRSTRRIKNASQKVSAAEQPS